MSHHSVMLQKMGIEQWLPRQPVAPPVVESDPLIRHILFYVNTYLLRDGNKSLDKITQYVETLKLSEIYANPIEKKRVLYDLCQFAL